MSSRGKAPRKGSQRKGTLGFRHVAHSCHPQPIKKQSTSEALKKKKGKKNKFKKNKKSREIQGAIKAKLKG